MSYIIIKNGTAKILTTINLSENNVSIYPEASPKETFRYMTDGDKVKITEVYQTYSDDLYYVLGKIENLVIPKTIDGKEVVSFNRSYTLSNKLYSVTIPYSVKEIGKTAFSRDGITESLTKIIFPEGINPELTIPDDKWGAINATIIIGRE